MAVDRPTFDENWYRVAELRPRLRSLVQVYRQHDGNRRWYVLRDPGNNQSFRVDDVAWALIALLDGRRTVAESWCHVHDDYGDRAPTQGEVIRLLGQLYTSNLLHSDMSKDAVGMFERFKRRRQREVGGYLMNLLFARIPLFDPDRMFDYLRPMLGWLFRPVGLGLWVVVMLAGMYHVVGQSEALFDQAQGVLLPGNLVYLYVCFAVIKLIHETGHGIACKEYGRYENNQGEVHTLGVMLLILTPVPYVDASSAWVFRSKWRRVMVGAAGMYVELAVAAIAAIVWARTADGTLIHALAYNTLFIASVSTVLFNANPLLRFDGYFILSDLLEMPNLNERSKQWLYYIVKRYVYRVQNPQNPANSQSEQIIFPIYGISAAIYRIFLGIFIILFVAETLPFVGIIMAIMAAITFMITPMVKFIHYLLTSPQLQRTRGMSLSITTTAFAIPLVLIAFLPVAAYAYAPGILQARRQVVIHAKTPGVLQLAQASGTAVKTADNVLVKLSEPDLHFERQALLATQHELQIRIAEVMAEGQESQRQAIAAQLRATEVQLDRIERDIASLILTSPIEGTWITPDLEQRQGDLIHRGESLGMVVTLDDLIVKVAADQWQGPRLIEQANRQQPVDMRIDGWPDTSFVGMIRSIAPAGGERMPAEAMGIAAGGRIMNQPQARRGDEAAKAVFEITIDVEERDGSRALLLPGQRVMVRFRLDNQTLMTQGWLYVTQLLQQRWSW